MSGHTFDSQYWLGRLSMAVALSLERPDPRAKDALEEFLKSDRPSVGLTKMIREEMRQK